MPKYTFTAKDPSGRTMTETTEAPDEDVLIERLQRQGLFVLNLDLFVDPFTQPRAAAAKKSLYTHHGINIQDMLIFARQLATMLESGVTLLRSLDVILSQVESKQFSLVLSKVKNDVEQGAALSAALAKHPKVFDQFWVSLIEVGEASGTMPAVLEKLAFYIEQEAAFRSTIVSAIIYPAILFCVAWGAVGFFAFVVGPKFKEIFEAMKIDLPMITVVLLAVFDFIKTKFFLLATFFCVIFFLTKKYVATQRGGLQFEKLLFKIPTVGQVIKLIVVERFSSQMAILVDSGVPILHALDITQRLVNNRTCALVVEEVKKGVREGELLVAPMQRSQFFPPMAIQMIMVGEETGELSKMLKHVAKFYQTGVETFMKRFATMIEPLMLVFMGGVIGTIVLAMFLPMFNMATGGGVK